MDAAEEEGLIYETVKCFSLGNAYRNNLESCTVIPVHQTQTTLSSIEPLIIKEFLCSRSVSRVQSHNLEYGLLILS